MMLIDFIECAASVIVFVLSLLSLWCLIVSFISTEVTPLERQQAVCTLTREDRKIHDLIKCVCIKRK